MNTRVTVRLGGCSARIPRRALVVTVTIAVVVVIAICVSLAFGEYPISIGAVISGLVGHGSALNKLVVREIRLPRIALAGLVGGALGLSGAIFQSLTRNPLASPDIVGISEGAAVVAVAMIIGGVSSQLVPLGAFAGALGAMAIVVALGARRHFSFYRLILIGIAINVFGSAAVAYMLTKAQFTQAAPLAQQWLLGSVGAPGYQDVVIMLIALAVLLPVAFALARQLNALQLGEDLARALGVPVVGAQLALATVGALLAAVAVSVAGPIGFIAFVAPHIARRLTRAPGAASLPASALTGALLLIAADYAAQRIFEPTVLPDGITTIVVGAPYLLYLLARAERDAGVA